MRRLRFVWIVAVLVALPASVFPGGANAAVVDVKLGTTAEAGNGDDASPWGDDQWLVSGCRKVTAAEAA